MSPSNTRTAFWRGFRAALPFSLMVVPFGTIFGVIAIEAGLDLLEAMSMTVLVIAGASQLTALQLMMDDAPLWVVVLSALAVNLRMAMYSAALAPHLGPAPFWTRACAAYLLFDQTYALSVVDYEDRPADSTAAKVAFYFGSATPILPLWLISSYAGAVLGTAIPEEFGLEFAVPIMFLAIIGPALRTPAHIAAAFAAIVSALALSFLPWNLWLIAAGLVGMMVGAEVERRTEVWKARQA